jgi:hypothetical protein
MTGYESKKAAAIAKTIDEVNWADHEPDGLAQPAQEPAAWITPDGGGFRIRFSPPTNKVPLGWDAFYTTPPQRPWVGLTNEIIENIFQSAADADEETHIRFARAIEQHLKSKNT